MSLTRSNAKFSSYLFRVYGDVVSDEECKDIRGANDIKELAKAIVENGPPYNENELKILMDAAGKMDHYDFERDGHMWRDDILKQYADHITNYEYTYNDEALKVDPNIDTSEKHIGPMAQDIEKVNPAAVKEDPKSGYKTVDTGRLALMNAGAIADLARQVQELKV